MNGPTPIMSIMLSAVALPRPIPRMRWGDWGFVVSRSSLAGRRSFWDDIECQKPQRLKAFETESYGMPEGIP